MKHLYLIIFFFSSLLAFNTRGQAPVPAEKMSVQVVDLKIYPNPTVESFSINGLSEQVHHITINNIIGKQLKHEPVISHDQKFDVSDLSRGVYIIRIFNHDDKLIKALRLSKA